MTEELLRQNERYLAARLKGLRLRLVSFIADQTPQFTETVTVATPPQADTRPWWAFWQVANGPAITTTQQTSTLPLLMVSADDDASTEQEIREIEQRFPDLPLKILVNHLELSSFEEDILLLCAGIELDTRIATLCAKAHDNSARTYPTFALALALFEAPTWDALSPERPLRHWRLVEIVQAAAQPLTVSPLRIDERILNYLKGLNTLDSRLKLLLQPIHLDLQDLAESQHQAAEAGHNALKRFELLYSQIPIIHLQGGDTISRQLVASYIANRENSHLLHLSSTTLPFQASELELVAGLWTRECALLPLALYLDSVPASPDQPQGSLRRFLERTDGLVFVDSAEPLPQLDGRSVIVLDVSKPTSIEQHSAWEMWIGPVDAAAPAELASLFNLNLMVIRQISQSVLAEESTTARYSERLKQKCAQFSRPNFGTLAERIVPKASWAKLVLPKEANHLLRLIVEQVRHRMIVYDTWAMRDTLSRGLGISVLFAGPSGTGKTMAAEVLAAEVGLELYRIDLSSVVSKYIGETEKNLAMIFTQAQSNNAILFFDEADALFGKRSEVKDSHDRYANIEINYLLQRIESYEGLAILASNKKAALDTAFLRRLRFIIDFPFPGPAERKRIWSNVFPPGIQTYDLDLTALADYDLTGGSIQNIALNAAFLAAAQGASAVDMCMMADAIYYELRKQESPIPPRLMVLRDQCHKGETV